MREHCNCSTALGRAPSVLQPTSAVTAVRQDGGSAASCYESAGCPTRQGCGEYFSRFVPMLSRGSTQLSATQFLHSVSHFLCPNRNHSRRGPEAGPRAGSLRAHKRRLPGSEPCAPLQACRHQCQPPRGAAAAAAAATGSRGSAAVWPNLDCRWRPLPLPATRAPVACDCGAAWSIWRKCSRCFASVRMPFASSPSTKTATASMAASRRPATSQPSGRPGSRRFFWCLKKRLHLQRCIAI